jgi:TPR repeat protein
MSKRLEELRAKAVRGLTPAQIELAQSYLVGKDFDGNAFAQDFDQARYWLECAHERGASTATVLLGRLYEEGKGVAADVHKAIEYYELADQHGAYLPSLYLARIYARGKGIPVSERLAVIWYSKVLGHEGRVEDNGEMKEAREYIQSHDHG